MFFKDQAWGMDKHRLPDDQSIFDQLPDLLMGVGIGDFISLTGFQANLLFATEKDTAAKPLLKPEQYSCMYVVTEVKVF